MIEEASRVMRKVDLLATPSTVVEEAPLISECAFRTDPSYMELRRTLTGFTMAFDVLGNPTISVPGGFTEGGLPTASSSPGAPGRRRRCSERPPRSSPTSPSTSDPRPGSRGGA